MSRLLVIKFSNEVGSVDLLNTGTTERNRFVSWESVVQRSTKSAVKIPSCKIAIFLNPLRLARNFTKSISGIPIKLLYTFFNIGYKIAKFFTRVLTRIRSSLFAPR
jgi:hypothetical protein